MPDGFTYPFPTFQSPQQHQTQQVAPVPAQPAVTGATLMCDQCNMPIEKGEEAINGLYGVGGIGKRNLSPAVVPTKDIPNGEWDVHYYCLASFIVESFPEIADEVIAYRDEAIGDDPPEECYCEACGVGLLPDE